MVFRFYYPYLRTQLWMLPLLSVCVFLATLVFNPADYVILYGMCMSLLSFALALSPLAFGAQRGREAEAMLPALGIEKCIVVLGWAIVAVPVLIQGPVQLLSMIVHGTDCLTYTVNNLSAEARAIVSGQIDNVVILSTLSSLGIILSCLWGVFGSSRNRILWGVLAVLFFYCGVMFLSMIMSFSLGIYTGFNAAVEGVTIGEHEIMTIAAKTIDWLFKAFIPVCGIYIIFALVKCCRAIARHQL